MLIKKTKNDKKWYEVHINGWCSFITARDTVFDAYEDWDIYEEIRDFFDPFRNKSGKHGTRWKFSNRKDAEQMYMMAVLRWA